jgi:hypothetical protein
MAISELQMGLVGAGGVVVVGIFAFNKWQERKHRKAADALAKVGVQEPLAGEPAAGGERVEPVIGAEAPPRPSPVTSSSGRQRPPGAAAVAARGGRAGRLGGAHRVHRAVVAGQFWHAAAQHLDGLGKPVRWFGFSDTDNRWEPLNPHGAARYHWLCAALQLVDRRGAATDGDLAHLAAGLQRVCDAFMAIPSLPARPRRWPAAPSSTACAPVSTSRSASMCWPATRPSPAPSCAGCRTPPGSSCWATAASIPATSWA